MGNRYINLVKLIAVQEWHPTGKLVKKLNQQELESCIDFLIKNEALSNDEFTTLVNRWFLDNPDRPKHWAEMCDLLIQCMNSI